VAVPKHNSGAESGRELFVGSKDLTSLVLCNEKKHFWLFKIKNISLVLVQGTNDAKKMWQAFVCTISC